MLIAFIGILDYNLLWTLIISNYIFKVGVEVLFTPITYGIVRRLKKEEETDVYDVGTDFNPFSIK